MNRDITRCHGQDFNELGMFIFCPERETCKRYTHRESGGIYADGLCDIFGAVYEHKIEEGKK